MMKNNPIFTGALLMTFSLVSVNGKFFKIGPCVFKWGEECPDPYINFYLYTRENMNIAQRVIADDDNITNSYFSSSRVNKVIIHGYNSDMLLDQLVNIKNGLLIIRSRAVRKVRIKYKNCDSILHNTSGACVCQKYGYLKTQDYNVWMIDWSYVAAGPCYPVVVTNIDYVAKCTSVLIKKIANMSSLPAEESLHLIGFSVGAHVAAYVANHVRPFILPRITGLDPAMPLFITRNKDRKLDKTDALFVDVIHTDALTEGLVEQCGHLDFYMNGGFFQPGCWNGNIFDTVRCNHHRAPTYFSESITTTVGFYGWKCGGFWQYIKQNCSFTYPDTIMGEYVDKKSSGYYIVNTASQSPYAIGHNESIEYLWDTWTANTVLFQKRVLLDMGSQFMPSG